MTVHLLSIIHCLPTYILTYEDKVFVSNNCITRKTHRYSITLIILTLFVVVRSLLCVYVSLLIVYQTITILSSDMIPVPSDLFPPINLIFLFFCCCFFSYEQNKLLVVLPVKATLSDTF